MKNFKAFGLHHVAILLGFTVGFSLIHTLLGMAAAIFWMGWYGGKEENEAEFRGLDLFDKSTWSWEKFQIPHFAAPWIVGIISLVIMWKQI